MAETILYTNTDAIRACIGLDVAECKDSVMVDSKLDMELEVDLAGWLPSYAAVFEAGDAADATDEQVLQQKMLKLYCQWLAAAEILARSLVVPLEVTNGKDKYSRFSKIDLAELAAAAKAKAEGYKVLLEDEINGPVTFTGLTLLVASIPDLDPVTEAPP